MGLTNAYTIAPSRLPALFDKIRDGQAPEQLSLQMLKDWGFSSSNDRAMLRVLKALGFLSPDGKPTTRYHDYRDHSRSKAVMAVALQETYGDVFLIKEHPTQADRDAVLGKFKSFHNSSDNVATLMTKTFYTLLDLADLKAKHPKKRPTTKDKDEPQKDKEAESSPDDERIPHADLHYNIQIHLPATKDVEVYNAIFKSLREHLVE